MNELEEIQGYIKKFICEKEQKQKQIRQIEEKRTLLAQERNEKKKLNSNDTEINQIGRRISELGVQSQDLQNELDYNCHVVKTQMSLRIDNLIAEGIRKIRIITQEIQEVEERIVSQKGRRAKYQLQRQEFYARFGRFPDLSERAQKEYELQEKEVTKSELEVIEMRQQILEAEEKIELLAKAKKELKNGNWKNFANIMIPEEIRIEELHIEEMEPIEEIYIEDFGKIEELYVEEFYPVEEISVEEFSVEEFNEESLNIFESNKEKTTIDEIEELARQIVEEIVAEQTKELELSKDSIKNDIIIFEQEEKPAHKSKVIIPLFGQKATILSIIVKIENGELVYKAQMSDEEEVKIYPSKLGEKSVLLRDKQNRDECRDILTNYAINEYKNFDKKVVNQIDPLICELLIECAEEYGYDAQELIYNYSMSFSYAESESTGLVPNITYNLSYLENSNLSKKEKGIIKKICKSAKKNEKVDVIESFSRFKKIKYILKRLFAINNVKVLPEAKY